MPASLWEFATAPATEEQLDRWKIYCKIWKDLDYPTPSRWIERWIYLDASVENCFNPEEQSVENPYKQQAIDYAFYSPFAAHC